MLRHQDTYDDFFCGESARDKGSLYNIKQNFRHRSAKKSVYAAFNHCNDLMSFATEGFVCLLAMKIMGTSMLDEKPANFVGRAVTLYLRQVAERIVSTVWMPYEGVEDVIDAEIEYDDDDDDDDEDACNLCWCKVGKARLNSVSWTPPLFYLPILEKK